jgi:NAD(P)H-dependent nitrite reductase small subunit
MPIEIDEEALEAARRELNGELPDSTELREFTFACNFSEIPSNGRRGKVVTIDEQEIALFNLNGEIFAISNICPHEMSPLLAAGFVDCEARTVACPLHGWTFEIPTGKFIGASGSIPVYDLKLADGEVWVKEKTE